MQHVGGLSCRQLNGVDVSQSTSSLHAPLLLPHPGPFLPLCRLQVTYVTACAELYFSSLCSLMHERQALHAALVQADGALSECQRRLLGVDGTLDQLTVLERLSSNLKKEHVLRIMLNCFVWGRILTAVQFAKTAGRQGERGREAGGGGDSRVVGQCGRVA
jgi:hypothetical protein